MNNVIDSWLKSDGWTGIVARVVCELLFLVLILNAVGLAAWAERLTSGRALMIDEKKALLVQHVAIAMVCVGLLVELVNIAKLMLRKRREGKQTDQL